MKVIKTLVLIWAVLVYSCSSEKQFPDVPRPPEGPLTPLYNIYTMSQRGDYTGLEEELFGVITGAGNDSRKLLADGIRQPVAYGDFSYSPRALRNVLVLYPHFFKPASEEMLEAFFYRPGALFGGSEILMEVARNRQEEIYVLKGPTATMMTAKVMGKWRLIFSQNMVEIHE